MKMRTCKNSEQGSLLLASMCIAGIIAIALASFLTMAQSENISIYRSQTWNNSITLTESGTEEALALINKYSGTSTSPENWTNSALWDGWSLVAPNVYYVQRYIGSDNYQVYITNLNDKPTIKATGYVQWTYQSASASPQTMFAAIGLNPAPSSVNRSVVITTGRNSPFTGAILVKKGVVLNGGTVDSFNSQDPNYSTNGHFIVSKRKAGGDIGTIESNVVAAVTDTGGAFVYGHVATGPNSTVTSSGSGSIGDIGWINGGSTGVEPGWSRSDMNVTIQDAALPNMTGAFVYSGLSSFPSGSPGSGNTTNYTYLVSPVGGSGKYKITDNVNLGGSQTMCINGNVSLYFSSTANNSFVNSGSAFIYLTPGSNLKMYFGGGASVTGGGVVNSSGFATNCAFYGLPGCTALTYSGSSGFVGTVYAPEADVTLSGGTTGMNFVGSLVGNSVNISGSYSFHYDESLGGPVQQPFYYITSWKEVSP